MKIFLLACLPALLPAPVRAQQAAAAPQAQAPAPPVQGRPVEEPVVLVPVTTELLTRWGLDPERYRALSAEEKAEVQRELSRREPGRIRRVELVTLLARERCAAEGRGRCGGVLDVACHLRQSAACDEAARRCVTPEGRITAEGEALLAEHLARQENRPLAVPAQVSIERKDGKPLSERDLAQARVMLDKMFDGVQALQRRGETPPAEIVWDASFQNGTLHHLSATNPKNGLSLEIGQLGVNGRSALLAPSWYGNLTKKWESRPESWVDYRVHAQIGYVNLKARYFNDGPDPRVGRTIDLMRRLGLPEAQAGQLRDYTSYDDAYKAQGMVVTSLLTEVGRAYNLFGPVDVSWTVGNLTRIVMLAPNTAFDETLGFRVRLKDDLFMGVFVGATQNISPTSNRLLQEAMSPDGVQAGVNVENAPHATLALWGDMPGVSDVTFKASAGARWNRDTTVHQGELALTTSLYDRPLTLRGMASVESGPGIEFDRRKLRAQLDYQLSDNALAYLAFEKEKIRYGNAEVDSDAFLAGFEILFGAGPDRSSVSYEQLFGGQFKGRAVSPELPEVLTRVNRAMVQGVDAAAAARDAYERLRAGPLSPAQMQTALDRLSLALQRLDAETAARLVDELAARRLSDAQRRQLGDLFLRTVNENSDHYRRLQELLADGGLVERADEWLKKLDDASAFFTRHEPDIRELVSLLGDKTLWDAVAVSVGRAAMIKALSKTETVTIPLIDKDMSFSLSPPVLLAAANALQGRLSPLAPVRAGEVEPWLLREAGSSLGIPGDQVTAEMIAQELFDRAGREIGRAINERLAPRLDPILDDLAHYNPQDAARRILAALPPTFAQSLQARYGQDLSGLLPAAGVNPDQVRDFLLNRLPGELMAHLEREFGDDVARHVAELTSWAAEIIRREINMTLIHLLLASEELNRLTVDKGLKLSDLNVRMAMSSFERLDARRRGEVQDGLRLAARRLAEDAAIDEARLAARFLDYGKARLDALQLDPSWPRGLTVEIADKDWLPLLTLYGDGELFALFDRIKDGYRETPEGLAISLAFDPHSQFGTSIRPSGSKDAPAVRFELGRPKDERAGRSTLGGLERYAAEHQAERALWERWDAAQRADAWPKGLRVEASLGTLASLERHYGKKAAAALLARLGALRAPGGGPLTVHLEFDYAGAHKPEARKDPRTGAWVVSLAKPRDARDADIRLDALTAAVRALAARRR